MSIKHQILDAVENWAWKQLESDSDDIQNTHGWSKASRMPSEVHVELLQSGSIPDPYIGFNEHTVQWVGDVEWLYRCEFGYEPSANPLKHGLLSFEGLDTICDVYLNGVLILNADNMFRTYNYAFPVKTLQQSNSLLLHFKSAKAFAKAEEAKRGKVRAGSTNLGDSSRVYVRKAQYDWRWDWGPELMTCGPYRPIKLITYNARLKDVQTCAYTNILSASTFTVSLRVGATLTGSWDTSVESLVVKLIDPAHGNRIIKSARVRASPWDGDGDVTHDSVVIWSDLQKDGVELWWPVNYGGQALYVVELSLVTAENEVLDTVSNRIGFRTAKLVQEDLADEDQYGKGTTFLFEINGVRMFMGGSNWVPGDNFLTTITKERYRDWLTLLRDGNQNMVRLWGGGVYEPDVFYDVCDELGILVWQDFQFACGVYPAHDAFVASVKQEAEDNVLRLRHHPAIVCFCGNNEDYQLVLQWGDIDSLPARVIYEQVLPEIVSRLTDPPVPYHRGSPYGGKGWDTSDPTIGDVHQWNIWGGKELQYQEYNRMGGRFVSEFGMPGMPCMNTIEYWMQGADKRQFYAQSQLMAQHTKAGSFERRFAIVMNENFKLTSDLESHVYNTQLMQSEAVSFAYRSWRREWRGRGREFCAGVLVWQLNDCWPVVSWAIADYFLRPKPVYYTIARNLGAITVGIFRNVVKNRDNDRPRQFYEFGAVQTSYATLDVWGTNSTLVPVPVQLELTFYDLVSPDWSTSEIHDVVLLPNQSTELLQQLICPGPNREEFIVGEPLRISSATVVSSARLLDPVSGLVLARYSDWPEPYRFLDPQEPVLSVHSSVGPGARETTLTLSVERPAKCVVLSVENEDREMRVRWSDNALDLVPGDVQEVVVSGLEGRGVRAAYFGREKTYSILERQS